jgi:hypothetical protein
MYIFQQDRRNNESGGGLHLFVCRSSSVVAKGMPDPNLHLAQIITVLRLRYRFLNLHYEAAWTDIGVTVAASMNTKPSWKRPSAACHVARDGMYSQWTGTSRES